MPYVLLVAAALGHVILWVAIVNRLHALAMKRTLMHALTALCGLGLVVTPPAVAWPYFQAWRTGGELPSFPPTGTPAALYVMLCVLVFVAGTAHRLWSLLHAERRGAVTANHTTRFKLRNSTSEPLTAGGLPAWLARLPGNQVLSVHVHEKQLVIPRLPPQLDGVRIAHLSDLHMSGRIAHAYFREVAARVNECQPDIIAITGDIIERDACIDWIPDTLGQLRAPGGVFYIRGNHDLKVDQDKMSGALAAAGLIHLGENVERGTVRGESLILVGNELPWFGPVPQPPVSSPQPPAFRILLSHSPDQFAWAQQNDFDVMLAGHNHGGQVRLPFFGALLAPSRHGIRYAAGTFRRGNTVLHVSRGTASHTPLRYNCPPEIAILVLNRPAS